MKHCHLARVALSPRARTSHHMSDVSCARDDEQSSVRHAGTMP